MRVVRAWLGKGVAILRSSLKVTRSFINSCRFLQNGSPDDTQETVFRLSELLSEQNLVKHVVKDYRNVYPEIMKRAARTFEQVFGLKLVEIDSKHHTYILINNLEAADRPPPVQCPANPKLGLLFVILGVTFMKGGVVRENVIWNTLKKLRVDSGEKHEEFGDVKRLVTEEFVRQRYLEYVRIPHTEPMEHEFRWGQRADMEVSKAKILEFMGQLHEQDPQSWTQQFREAQSSSSSQR
uniref:Necdin-like 2 n=1 Tax=Oryzias melastigma TaxID=30732 RepID=A0A3B3CTZ7_ORYME